MPLWGSRRGGRPRVVPLGDAALIAVLATDVDLQVNARIQRAAASVRAKALPWVRDVVPAVGALAVHFDPAAVKDPATARAELIALVEGILADTPARPEEKGLDVLEVPVCYGGEFGIDLEAVAERAGLAPAEVVRRHAAAEHRVLMVGFAPGHPYIGGLDPKLAIPRRATPRTRVPEGSVAIANAQTAVYPFAISGGWNLIGRTPLRVFDALREPPALFTPGRRVRFVPVDRAEYRRLKGTQDDAA